MKTAKFFTMILAAVFVFAHAVGGAFAANERDALHYAEMPKCVEEKTGTEFLAVIKNESENFCVGTGLRIQYIFVEVYAAAFYIDKNAIAELKNHKGNLAKEIAEGDFPRIIVMKFLMDVSVNKLKERFLVGLKQTMPNPSQKTKNELNSFLDTLKDVKKGEEISIYFGYYVA
ncbi:MAG: chalcone isomerase family protein, partial [Patescibacteria group bacterium]